MRERPTKETVTAQIAIHFVQARILHGLQNKTIDLNDDSLRDIAEKVGLHEKSAQMIKHHLEQLVKLGAIQKINGEYVFTPSTTT